MPLVAHRELETLEALDSAERLQRRQEKIRAYGQFTTT